MAVSTKNFNVNEFTCKCGCGFNNMEQKTIDLCQTIRDALGVPVRINSGCRCQKHNANVGGVRNSQHLSGVAADLSCSLGAKAMFDKIKELYDAGMIPDLRYCIYYQKKNFVHVDTGRKRSKVFEIRK